MMDSALLTAQYGFSRPEKVLKALQRDAFWAQQFRLEDVYKKPTAEVPTPESSHQLATIWR